MTPIACVRCGVSFEPVRRTARYCSRQCADAVRAKRYRDRRIVAPMFAEQSKCPVCARPFLAIVGQASRRLFCSDECRATARKMRETDES